jgi:diacylglycerol kinase (ATP)
MKIKDIIFIINPNSGSNNSKGIIEALINYDKNVHYFISESISAFDDFFRININNYKVLVICGGDGTVNNSLKYLTKNKGITLAILPNGSGDGFANELGFKKDIKGLIKQILKGETESVDLVKVNDEYSCNMIGVGLDSHIAAEFEGSSKRGLKSYIYYTLKALFSFKPIKAEIDVNESKISGTFQMINIANTRQFGNNAYIAPDAKYNDGLLELVLMRPIPFYLIPSVIIKMFKGALKDSKYIQFIKTKQLTLKTDAKNYHVDGEFRPMSKELSIAIDQQFRIIKT